MRYDGYYPPVLVVVVSTSSMYCVKLLLLVLIQFEYYCYVMNMVNILPYSSTTV